MGQLLTNAEELGVLLRAITPNVYFQPPESVRMKYPCIRYKHERENRTFANNDKYFRYQRYQVIIIDQDIDSNIPDLVDNLIFSSFERYYTADDLHHWVYNITY